LNPFERSVPRTFVDRRILLLPEDLNGGHRGEKIEQGEELGRLGSFFECFVVRFDRLSTTFGSDYSLASKSSPLITFYSLDDAIRDLVPV
jgi:hypothetical protein